MEALIRAASLRDCEVPTELMRDQLREHEIPVDEARLRASIGGVLDDPERGFFLLAKRPDGGTIGAIYVPVPLVPRARGARGLA